jgi:hypothetical protein
MAKLKVMPSRLRAAPPRIGFAAGDARAADKARDAAAPWRAWYRTNRWRQLRVAVFARDAFICQRTGRVCMGVYPAPDSPVANHKRPHRGNAALFWDINNIETVAKHVHDGLIQAEEQMIPTGVWD